MYVKRCEVHNHSRETGTAYNFMQKYFLVQRTKKCYIFLAIL